MWDDGEETPPQSDGGREVENDDDQFKDSYEEEMPHYRGQQEAEVGQEESFRFSDEEKDDSSNN